MTTRYAVAAAGTVVVLTTLGIVAADRWPASLDADMPTARVTRGTLALDVQISGELRAKRSVPMTTPRAGVSLPLVVLAGTGAAVQAGDIVMEFDPAEQAHALEQSRSELEEAEQEIVKLQADADVRQAEDDVELLTARFDVRRAELQAVADLNSSAPTRRSAVRSRSRRRNVGWQSWKARSPRAMRSTARRWRCSRSDAPKPGWRADRRNRSSTTSSCERRSTAWSWSVRTGTG